MDEPTTPSWGTLWEHCNRTPDSANHSCSARYGWYCLMQACIELRAATIFCQKALNNSALGTHLSDRSSVAGFHKPEMIPTIVSALDAGLAANIRVLARLETEGRKAFGDDAVDGMLGQLTATTMLPCAFLQPPHTVPFAQDAATLSTTNKQIIALMAENAMVRSTKLRMYRDVCRNEHAQYGATTAFVSDTLPDDGLIAEGTDRDFFTFLPYGSPVKGTITQSLLDRMKGWAEGRSQHDSHPHHPNNTASFPR
jgi:hypothetical protein